MRTNTDLNPQLKLRGSTSAHLRRTGPDAQRAHLLGASSMGENVTAERKNQALSPNDEYL